MPTYTTTLKHALRWLTGSNVISDIDAGFQALAEDLDALIAIADKGIESALPTSTSGSPGKSGRFYYATDTARLFYDYGTGWLDVVTRPGLVTSLPTTNLYEGQVVHFQNAAMALAGVVWAFRYRAGSASAYKWEFIGGGTYMQRFSGSYTLFGASSVPLDLSTALTFTTTLAGEYQVDFGGFLFYTTGFVAQEAFLIPMGAEAFTFDETVRVGWTSGEDPTPQGNPHRNSKVCTAVAGGTIRLQGGANGSPNWGATKLQWAIRPIRVG